LLVLSLEELRHRTSVKWRRYPPEVLPLWVAELDVPLAAPVAHALERAIALGDTGYTHGFGYASALDEYTGRRWGWRFDPAVTVTVADVMRGIVEVLFVVTEPGSAVVINPPVYPPFYPFLVHANRRIVTAPLGSDHRLDLDALEAVFIAERPAAYLLCSPHNPTGTVHTAEELSTVATLAERYGVRVVVDEIHAPIVYADATFTPYLSLPGTEDAVALWSASKGWNLSGLKAAVAVPGERAAIDLAMLPEEVSHGPSHLGVIAHSAALLHAGEWFEALLAGLDENRRLMAGLVAGHLPEVRYRQPEGTFFAWLDCRALGLGPDPATTFLRRGQVALVPGLEFGTGGDGYVRLNLATSPSILTEAVRRMASVL
jgi:cystathionine beta-lyase